MSAETDCEKSSGHYLYIDRFYRYILVHIFARLQFLNLI